MLLEWVTERAVEGEEVSKEVGGHAMRPVGHDRDAGFDCQHGGSYRSTEECCVAAAGQTGGAGVQPEASVMVQVSADSKRVTVGRLYIPKVDSTRFAFQLPSQVVLLLNYSTRLEVYVGQRLSFKSFLYSQHPAQCLAHSKGPLLEPFHKWSPYIGSKLNCLKNSSDDIIPLAFGALHCLEIKS